MENHVCMQNVIVVVGGCSEQHAPKYESLRQAYAFDSPSSLVVIRTGENNFDFTALRALYRYRRHPLVAACAYMLIHDTCLCHASLPLVMLKFAHIHADSIYAPPPPAANICVFGENVLCRMADANAFATVNSKKDAMDVENCASKKESGIYAYGRYIRLARRRSGGVVWRVDARRLQFYYPDFGVYKYVTCRNTASKDIAAIHASNSR